MEVETYFWRDLYFFIMGFVDGMKGLKRELEEGFNGSEKERESVVVRENGK